MKMLSRVLLSCSFLPLAWTSSGCGLEALLTDGLGAEPELVVLSGALFDISTPLEPSATADVYLYDLQGLEVGAYPAQTSNDLGIFTVEIPPEGLTRPLRVVVVSGEKVFKGLLDCALAPEDKALHLELSLTAETTAAMLTLESMGTIRGSSRETVALNAYALASFSTDELQTAYDHVLSQAEESDAAGSFVAEVRSLLESASSSGSSPVFVLAPTSAQLLGETSLTNAETFNALGTAAADAAFEAVQAADIEPEFYDAERRFLTVIFTVSRAGSVKNGNCAAYDVCDTQGGKSFDCDPDATMFITGALHEESEIQDPTFENVLGSMTPNQAGWEMYDDGTHGDEVSGDQVFTRVFKLPEGLRIFYKYTWGKVGEKWTGTEEWPGNNRLLEVRDVNGDGYVWRYDHAKDEASNKDKVNLFGNVPGGVAVTWDSDLQGDGYLETQEGPIPSNPADGGLQVLSGGCWQDAKSFLQPTRVAKATRGQCRLGLGTTSEE
ncbi:MAG: choice-of-anchor X domain-containing protein [Myxococcota bacterium]